MITETEFSVQATKDIPRKERPKENDSSFQDIFTALTATLQMANPQVANSVSNGMAQTTGKNIQNTVRETSRRSGQDKKDLVDRLDQNNPKKADRPFPDKNQDTQESTKANNKPLEKDRTANDVQTSKKERSFLKPKKNMEDSGPAPESKEDYKEVDTDTQDTSPDEKAIRDTEPDLNTLFKALTGQDLPDNISNAQDLSQDSSVNQQLLTLLNEQGGKIEDLLVKAGMSETDAKNLLNKIETQVENSIQVRQALNGNLPAIEPQNPAETTDSFPMDKKAGSEVDAGSADKKIELLPDALSQIPKNQTNEVKTDNKKEIWADLPAKPEGKDQVADIPTDKGKEDLLRVFSSDQPNNIFPSQNSNSQDSDTDIKNLSNSSKNISEVSAKISEPAKVVSNTPNNLFADLSAKSINEIKQAHAPQEIIHSGTLEKPVITQIIEKFTLRTNGQQNEINIKLDPPDLGTVRINITSEGDHVKTTLITENHAVKQAIESNLSQLRDSMSDQGLKVQSFTVLVGGNQGQKGQNQQQQQGQVNLPGTPFQENSTRQENGETVLSGRSRFYDKSQSISVFA